MIYLSDSLIVIMHVLVSQIFNKPLNYLKAACVIIFVEINYEIFLQKFLPFESFVVYSHSLAT